MSYSTCNFYFSSYFSKLYFSIIKVESLLMGAMYDLLDFEPDRNAFVVIGSFAFLVPSAVLKKMMAHLMVKD